MLLFSTLQQFDISTTDFLMVLSSAGLVLFFLLAGICSPVLGLVTEGVYLSKRKAFYDKCAMQASQSALVFGFFIFFVLAGGAMLYTLQTEFNPDDLLGPMAGFIPPAVALIFWIFYVTAWSALKKHRVVHFLLGLIGCLLLLALLACGFILLANIQQPMLFHALTTQPVPVTLALLEDFISQPFMPLMLAGLVTTGIAIGAGLAQLWLIVRRNKADYGRDYYAFAMRYCARFALGFTLLSLALCALTFFALKEFTPPDLAQPQDLGITLIAAGLPLCCCLMWFTIIKSETPLRHKPGAFFACLFLYIALCAQMLMLAAAFPMN
ncbi:hypothetical protein LJC46_01545 [Desulfovibrio sp. OttesenSCG-928-G15]|nr:hypothetical protein [Desulfovibrio sp. OttesenSCG-928-G15]